MRVRTARVASSKACGQVMPSFSASAFARGKKTRATAWLAARTLSRVAIGRGEAREDCHARGVDDAAQVEDAAGVAFAHLGGEDFRHHAAQHAVAEHRELVFAAAVGDVGQPKDADELVDRTGDAARVGSAIGDGRGQGGVNAVAVDQRLQLVLRAALQAVGGRDVEVDALPAVGDGVEHQRPGQTVEVDDRGDGLEDLSPVGGDGLMMLGGDDGEEVDVAEGIGGATAETAGEEEAAETLVGFDAPW